MKAIEPHERSDDEVGRSGEDGFGFGSGSSLGEVDGIVEDGAFGEYGVGATSGGSFSKPPACATTMLRD